MTIQCRRRSVCRQRTKGQLRYLGLKGLLTLLVRSEKINYTPQGSTYTHYYDNGVRVWGSLIAERFHVNIILQYSEITILN
jgi:hypothetical protein